LLVFCWFFLGLRANAPKKDEAMMDDRSVLGLLKPIYLDDAPARGIRAAFALPPDRDDYLAYFCDTCSARLVEAAAQLGLSITDPSFCKRIGKTLIMHKPELVKNFDEWPHVILAALLTTIRSPGSRKAGRPRESNEVLAQLYADVSFLRRKTKLSDRAITSSTLRKTKGYKERYGSFKAGALREKYRQAVKLKDSDWQFRALLFGPGGLMTANKIDPVGAAIEVHPLQIWRE
jgi:hypothetical protein